MITTAMIGAISLNISFVLYLLVYLPQVFHNRKPNHIPSLSLGMHFILYTSYCLDLFYGFSRDLQWQYKTVSVVSLTLLIIQHLQITYHHSPRHPERSEGSPGCKTNSLHGFDQPCAKSRRSLASLGMTGGLLGMTWGRLLFNFNLFFLLATGLILYYFFVLQDGHLSEQATQTIGYISRMGFLIYTLPQIMKNRALKTTKAISINFIFLSLTLSMLDMTSAWCLDWGWPNKLGSPLTISLMLIMLMQTRKYHSAKINVGQISPTSCTTQ